MQRLVRLLLVLGAAAVVVGLVAALRRSATPDAPTYTFDETDEAGA